MKRSDIIELSCLIAETEVGYKGHPNTNNLFVKVSTEGVGEYTKYAEVLRQHGYYNGNKQGYDGWCTLGVDYCDLVACGYDKDLANRIFPNGTLGAGAKQSREYYRSAGREFKEPKRGDRIFYINDKDEAYHTGKVVQVDGIAVKTIEFNVTGNVCGYRSFNYPDKKVVFGRPFDEEASEVKVGAWVSIVQDAHCRNSKGDDKGYTFKSWVYKQKMYIGGMNEVTAHITTTKENADNGVYTGYVLLTDIVGYSQTEEKKQDDANTTFLLAEYATKLSKETERADIAELKHEKFVEGINELMSKYK